MKISLLPPAIRSQLNRRLESGEDDAPILAWLQSLPQVQDVAAASLDGQPINQHDLTAWKHRGRADDRLRAASIQAVQSVAAHVAELKQAVPVSLPGQLAVCVAADLATAWMPSPSPGPVPADPLPRARQLGPLVALLRRGDQYAERLLIRRLWLDLATQRHQDHLAAQKTKRDGALQPVRHQGGVSKETIAQLAEDLKLF